MSPPTPLPVTIVVRNFFPPLVAPSSPLLDGGANVSYDDTTARSDYTPTTSCVVSDVTASSSSTLPPLVRTMTTPSYIIDGRYGLATRRVLRKVRLDIVARRRRRRQQQQRQGGRIDINNNEDDNSNI